MGGTGSGRHGGRPTVENALQLDIGEVVRQRVICGGARVAGEMRFKLYGDQIDAKFETDAKNTLGGAWLRLRYRITDYRTGRELEVDDNIYLAMSRPPFGGIRWWFVCPRENWRASKLYLPLGGRHFWSRRAYRLGYASQRETVRDRALRKARKLRRRLGGELAYGPYPDKPKRMRWTTYARLIDRLHAADRIADRWLVRLAARFGMPA